MSRTKLGLLRSGDPNSEFDRRSAQQILNQHGLPSYLLGSSNKIDTCADVGVLARVLYLTPGVFCPQASSACLKVCLGHSSGRMRLPSQTRARDKRASLFLLERDYFLARLKAELYLLIADAMRLGRKPAARLNGSSDIPWEMIHRNVFAEFPSIQFYDYTKSAVRVRRFLGRNGDWPDNYYLTYSADADTPGIRETSIGVLQMGGTVAVPFHDELPATWWGYPVLDGDTHDARFLDPERRIIGLRAKGFAKHLANGFTFAATDGR